MAWGPFVPQPDVEYYLDDGEPEIGTAEGCGGRRRKRMVRRRIGFTAEWREKVMPRVGGKKFPYTAAGKKAAASAERALPSKKKVMKGLTKKGGR